MGPVLLQEEIGVPGENLRCLVEPNWTLLTCDKGNFNQITARSQNVHYYHGGETRALLPCHQHPLVTKSDKWSDEKFLGNYLANFSLGVVKQTWIDQRNSNSISR